MFVHGGEREHSRITYSHLMYYVACGILLAGFGYISEAVLNLAAFACFMECTSCLLSGQTFFMLGSILIGFVLILFSNGIAAHAKLIVYLGTLLFSVCLFICYFDQSISNCFAAILLLVLFSLGFNIVKYLVIYSLAERKNFAYLVMCMAWGRVGIAVLYACSFNMNVTAQLILILLVELVSVASLIVFETIKHDKIQADDYHNAIKEDVSAKYLIKQAIFIIIVLATLRMFTPLGSYSTYPTINIIEQIIATLCVPLVAWLIFVKKSNRDMQSNYAIAFFIMLSGLFLIGLQSSATWLLSERTTTLLILCLMNFGHVVYWNIVVSICWLREKRSLMIIGGAMIIFSGCSILWIFLLGNFAQTAVTAVIVFSYLCVWAIWKLYPRVVVKTEEEDNTQHLMGIAKAHNLSPRETDVFLLLAQGRSRKYIQQKLYISDGTAKTHISRIYQKFDVKDKQSLLAYILDDNTDLHKSEDK